VTIEKVSMNGNWKIGLKNRKEGGAQTKRKKEKES
jgi:hypothetical protein